MKKRLGSVITLVVSALLLTSCTFDGNFGSEHYSPAKDAVAAAGLDAKVSAGKMNSGNEFVTLDFDEMTGDELVRAVTVLITLPLPAEADRRVNWKSEDKLAPSHLMFSTSQPNMDRVTKFAQAWDVVRENAVLAHYSIPDGIGRFQPEMHFTLKDSISKEDFKATVNGIKIITEQPSQKTVTGTVVTDPAGLLFGVDAGNVGISAIRSQDETDKAVDLLFEMDEIAQQRMSAYPNVASYGIGLNNHSKETGSSSADFSIYFDSEIPSDTKPSDSDRFYKESNDFNDEIQLIFHTKADTIGYW